MPIFLVGMYSAADLGVTAANWVAGTFGTLTGQITVAAGGWPSRVEIDDTDAQNNIFNDGAPGSAGATPFNQRLTGEVDGVQFTNATTNPENAYQLTDSDGNFAGFLLDVHSTNSNSFNTLQGFVSTAVLTPGETYSLQLVTSVPNIDYSNLQAICFARGTRICSVRGALPVEQLRVGDLIQTFDNGLRPIRWIGNRTLPVTPWYAPIVIRPGALGNSGELRVSPQHRMLIMDWRAEVMFGEREILVPAKSLLAGDSVYRDLSRPTVEYFHLLFDNHEIVFSEGIPSESLYLGDVSMKTIGQAACNEVLTIFPELRAGPPAFGSCARPSIRPRDASALILQDASRSSYCA